MVIVTSQHKNTEADVPFFVSINANARRGPYRIETALDIDTIHRERRRYIRDISPGCDPAS